MKSKWIFPILIIGLSISSMVINIHKIEKDKKSLAKLEYNNPQLIQKLKISYQMQELKEIQLKTSNKIANCAKDKYCDADKSYKELLFSLRTKAQMIRTLYERDCPDFKISMDDYVSRISNLEKISRFNNNPDVLSKLDAPKQLENQIKVALSGTLAERIFYSDDEISAGSYSDLKSATQIAQNMVLNLGMGKNRSVFDFNDGRLIGKSFQLEVEHEIKSIIEECETEVIKLLNDNKKNLDLLVSELIKVNRMSGIDMVKILNTTI